MNPLASLSEVERISALQDPDARNLLITRSYHALSAAMQQHSGPGANWCTFATWASRQAGVTIRQEDLSQQLDAMMQGTGAVLEEVAALATQYGAAHTQEGIRKIIWDTLNPFDAMVRASDAVGRGNGKVYAEIGREFARFIAECLPDSTVDPARVEAFNAGLRVGEPPEGQDYLKQAFSLYYSAIYEPDGGPKAEKMLFANLLIGFHEQTRLQPEIAEALNASIGHPDDLVRQITSRLFPENGFIGQLRSWFRNITGNRTPVETMLYRMIGMLQQRIRLWMTERMMVLQFPNGRRIRLGEDLTGAFPDRLQHLTNEGLKTLLARVDLTSDTLIASGAFDWADFKDRMHFISDLFRRYHEDPDLFQEPDQ